MQLDKQVRTSSGIRHGAGYTTCTGPCVTERLSQSFALLVIVVILGVGGATGTANATQFNPPKLDGYSLANEHDADGDGDGVKETHVQQYYNADWRQHLQHDDQWPPVGLESGDEGRVDERTAELRHTRQRL